MAFHLAVSTPFIISHRQSDDSPIKEGTRMRGKIISANFGATINEKVLMI